MQLIPLLIILLLLPIYANAGILAGVMGGAPHGTFTGSGTFPVPSKVTQVYITMTGGGGGGGAGFKNMYTALSGLDGNDTYIVQGASTYTASKGLGGPAGITLIGCDTQDSIIYQGVTTPWSGASGTTGGASNKGLGRMCETSGCNGGSGGAISGYLATTPGENITVHVGAKGNGGGYVQSDPGCLNGGNGGDGSVTITW